MKRAAKYRDSRTRPAVQYEFVLDKLDLVSPNKMLRMHWATRREWKDIYSDAVWAVTEKWSKHLDPCHIKIERLFTGRQKAMDPDNLVGSVKFLLDGMRSCGVISDDNPECISLEVHQRRTDTKAIRVTIQRKAKA